MFLNISYCLSQGICSPMLMITVLESVLVEYHQRFFCRILCTMKIPVVTSISTLYRYIPPIHQNDIKILSVYFLQILSTKHQHSPHSRTMQIAPAPQSKSSVQNPFLQNIFHKYCLEVSDSHPHWHYFS